MRHLAREAFALKVEELQLQAWGATAAEMYSCGLDLMDIDSRILVKLPVTLEGAKAAAKLVADGAPVTMTGAWVGGWVGGADVEVEAMLRRQYCVAAMPAAPRVDPGLEA